MEVDNWLEVIEQILYRFGKKVRKIDEIWEMHARGFEDGHFEAEIEISRDFLEHLDDRCRRPAISELAEILDKYNIPYEIVGDNLIETRLDFPETLTPWKPIVAVFGVFAILLWLG